MGFNFKQKASTPVRGGKGKMFGKGHTGTQTPGQTAAKPGASGKVAAGGKGKMFGFSGSKPSKAR